MEDQQPKLLQTQALLSFLSAESRAEVLSQLLRDTTLDNVLEHPVVLEGYREYCLNQDYAKKDDQLWYMLSKTKDAKLLRTLFETKCQLFNAFRSRNDTRCFKADDGGIVIIDDFFDGLVKFDLDVYQVENFDFQKHIVDSGIAVENVRRLTFAEMIPNPDWSPEVAWNVCQCIPKGQREVVWWDNCL